MRIPGLLFSSIVFILGLSRCVSDAPLTVDGGADATPDVAADVSIAPDTSPVVDATPDVEAEAHVWSPADLPNLVLWLDPADISLADQARIDTWTDRSSSKNDALGDQIGGDNRPTLIKTGINNKPSVRFSYPAYFKLVDNTSLQWGASDYAIVLVARYSNPMDGTTWALFYRKQDGGSTGIHFFGNSLVVGPSTKIGGWNLQAQAVESSGSGYNNNAAHVFALVRTGAAIQIMIDGSIVGSVNQSPISDISTVGADVTLGGYPGVAGLQLQGDIADYIAIKGVLSTSDRTTLMTYLKTKYGL